MLKTSKNGMQSKAPLVRGVKKIMLDLKLHEVHCQKTLWILVLA